MIKSQQPTYYLSSRSSFALANPSLRNSVPQMVFPVECLSLRRRLTRKDPPLGHLQFDPRAAPARSLMRSFLGCGVCGPGKRWVFVHALSDLVSVGQMQPQHGRVTWLPSARACASLWVSQTPSVVLAARTTHSSDYLVRNPSPFLGGAKPGRLSSGCSSIPIPIPAVI